MDKILLIICCLFCASCQKKAVKEDLTYSELMGEKTKKWQFIATREDLNVLNEVEKMFHRNLGNAKGHEIPRVAHFVWVGPKEFPESSKKFVASWIRNNPEMHFKFWTDRERSAPHPQMERVVFKEYPFKELKSEYLQSDNWAERSDLLRYEILLNEGGLYVDHDVECLKSFAALNEGYDFYCGLEPPHIPIVNSSVTVCNNVVGTSKGHPILQETIKQVKANWEKVGKAYPGKDRDSVIYRVANRTFAPFDNAVQKEGEVPGYRNAIFPAGYFNKIEGEFGLFADHKYTGTWYQEIDPFEELVRKSLDKMSKKTNKMLLLCGITFAFNLILGALLFYAIRSRSRANA